MARLNVRTMASADEDNEHSSDIVFTYWSYRRCLPFVPWLCNNVLKPDVVFGWLTDFLLVVPISTVKNREVWRRNKLYGPINLRI